MTVTEGLKNFYEVNKGILEKNYPGITFRRIDQEFKELPPEISYEQFTSKLKDGIPLQYISGKAWFYNHEFVVDSRVLIPRFETELLVEKALQWIEKSKKTKVCDVGTGSGIILLSIAANSKMAISGLGIDISPGAIEIAKRNNYLHRFAMPIETSLDFALGDRLNGVIDFFDLIVSNPPYIRQVADKKLVHKQVDTHEPSLALYLPDEEYDKWFDKFFHQCFSKLNPNGLFLMEGHEDHLDHLAKMATAIGFNNVQVEKDLTGRARFLRGEKWTN